MAYIKNISEQGAPEKWRRSEWKKATGAEVQNKNYGKCTLRKRRNTKRNFAFAPAMIIRDC